MKNDVLANFLCTIWVAALGLALVPIYVKILGIETYGLIGFFAALQVWLNLLDAGLSPALSREMSRYLGNVRLIKSTHDLLRSVELIFIGVVVLIIATGSLASNWIAIYWLSSTLISSETLRNSILIAFWSVAFSLVEILYRSALIGLQKHAALAKITASLATVRGGGAVAVLLFVSPTPEAFFLWQALMTGVSVLALNRYLYKALPGQESGQFSMRELAGIKSYALSVVGISMLATVMTQSDKLILSSHLPLAEWGYYSIALVISGAMGLLYQPIYQAWLPKMSEIVAQKDNEALGSLLHIGTQLVTTVVGSAALVLLFYADVFLTLWTQEASLAAAVSPILKFLAIGTFLNSLMAIPYGLQLAHGWTSLSLKANAVAACIIVPLLFVVVPKYGSLGAAALWVLLNLGYVGIVSHLMFRELLRSQRLRWYTHDIAMPLVGAIGMLFLTSLVPVGDSPFASMLHLLLSSVGVLLSAGLASPDLRAIAFHNLIALRSPNPGNDVHDHK